MEDIISQYPYLGHSGVGLNIFRMSIRGRVLFENIMVYIHGEIKQEALKSSAEETDICHSTLSVMLPRFSPIAD